MWKYIVTWAIVVLEFSPCPSPPPQYDEFGRRIGSPLQSNAVACFTRDTTYKERVFDKRSDAVLFIQRGNDNKSKGIMPSLGAGELTMFKLDSIAIKPKR